MLWYDCYWQEGTTCLVFMQGPPGFGFWTRAVVTGLLGEGQYKVEHLDQGGQRTGVEEEKAIDEIVQEDPDFILYSEDHHGPLCYPKTQPSAPPLEDDEEVEGSCQMG